jgi:hypothetical protein
VTGYHPATAKEVDASRICKLMNVGQGAPAMIENMLLDEIESCCSLLDYQMFLLRRRMCLWTLAC